MENKSTVELHEALALREGVTEIIIPPYETFRIVQDQRTHEFTGPARVLIPTKREISIVINFQGTVQSHLLSQHIERLFEHCSELSV